MMNVRLFIFVGLFSISAFGANSGFTDQPSPDPSSQPAEPNERAPIDCYISAIELGLSIHQSTLLCTGAKSQDPIRCFKHYDQVLTIDQKISLCQGATSSAPTACFDESYDLLLSFDQRTKLCNGANFASSASSNHNMNGTAPVHCFERSTELPLSEDERVILCASADSDNPVECFKHADSVGLRLDQRVRLCTFLAPSSW